jgi:branched-chain amino acid aminotransferase
MHRFLLAQRRSSWTPHEKSLSAGQVGLLNGWGVFSTLRVADGVPFAFERHWERMQRDAAKMHVPFPADPAELKSPLLRLVEANSAWNATLRVMVVRNRGGMFEGPDQERDFDVLAFTKDLNPWGAACGWPSRRTPPCANEFSGCKILSWSQNLTWYEEAQRARLRRSGAVERARRSQRMHIGQHLCGHRRRGVHSAARFRLPARRHSRVAAGRGARAWNRVLERTLTPQDLERADQVFITSTTRDLLPVVSSKVCKCATRESVVDPLVKALEEYREDYVKRNARR